MGTLGSIGAALGKFGQYYTSPEGLQTLAAIAKDSSAGGMDNYSALQGQRQKNAALLQQQTALKTLLSQMGRPDQRTGTLNEMIGANNSRLPVEQQSPLATPRRAGLDWTNPETMNAFSDYLGAGGSAGLPMGIADAMKPEDPRYVNTGDAVIRIGSDGQAAPIWHDTPKPLPAPPGYRWTPNGDQEFIKGGPGDPKVRGSIAAATRRPLVGRATGGGGSMPFSPSAPSTKTIGGRTYYKVRGEWYDNPEGR